MRIVVVNVVKFAISSIYQCCNNSYHIHVEISCALLQNLQLLASHNFAHMRCVLNITPPSSMTDCA
jgi:hypothetical protein